MVVRDQPVTTGPAEPDLDHNGVVCGVLPPFDPDTGRLPEGEHAVSWDELVDRFGWTPRRRQLIDGLAEAIELLAAAGCTRVVLTIGGSS